jgi:YVTN family beta-propeller protein
MGRHHPEWDTRLRRESWLRLGSNTVSVIATATNTVVATVTVHAPVAVAVSPNGQDVYVSKQDGTNKVRVIATATNTKVAAIPVGNGPLGVAVGP